MPEFLTLVSPESARELLFTHLHAMKADSELVQTISALDRVTAEAVLAPHPLPEFPRSTVDGYAVRAQDTFGAADSMPAYLNLIGEVPMGGAPSFEVRSGQCALIYTGGMLPDGADAVVMQEYTQGTSETSRDLGGLSREIEVMRPVADGENVIRIGEDVVAGQLVIPRGSQLRPAEIGGLSRT